MATTNVAGAATGNRSIIFSYTFHVESLRFVGLLALVLMLGICAVITVTYINPRFPPENTVIYRIFGFNHSCNLADRNPARMVAAILLPTVTIPLLLYVIFSYVRLRRAAQTHRIPNWLLVYSTVTSPYNFFAFVELHMWFVNTPDAEYGFVAHYVPYAMLQVALAFIAFQNVAYLTFVEQLPLRAKPWMAYTYLVLLVGVTLCSKVIVVSNLAGSAILDPHNQTHVTITKIVSNTYLVLAILLPIGFAFVERKNGDNITICFDATDDNKMDAVVDRESSEFERLTV